MTPNAADYPVLQATRFSTTQALAARAAAPGYDGVAHPSNQRHGSACYAPFEHVLPALRALAPDRPRNLHRFMATVAQGGCLPLA